MKKEQKPSIQFVKNDIKNFYFQEKYRYYIKGREKVFDKQYILLSNTFDCNWSKKYYDIYVPIDIDILKSYSMNLTHSLGKW